MKNILVLCTGNSCRSQIAHGWLNHYTDSSKIKVYSAGIEAHGLNSMAIETMNEIGLDISHHNSNLISEYNNIKFSKTNFLQKSLISSRLFLNDFLILLISPLTFDGSEKF